MKNKDWATFNTSSPKRSYHARREASTIENDRNLPLEKTLPRDELSVTKESIQEFGAKILLQYC